MGNLKSKTSTGHAPASFSGSLDQPQSQGQRGAVGGIGNRRQPQHTLISKKVLMDHCSSVQQQPQHKASKNSHNSSHSTDGSLFKATKKHQPSPLSTAAIQHQTCPDLRMLTSMYNENSSDGEKMDEEDDDVYVDNNNNSNNSNNNCSGGGSRLRKLLRGSSLRRQEQKYQEQQDRKKSHRKKKNRNKCDFGEKERKLSTERSGGDTRQGKKKKRTKNNSCNDFTTNTNTTTICELSVDSLASTLESVDDSRARLSNSSSYSSEASSSHISSCSSFDLTQAMSLEQEVSSSSNFSNPHVPMDVDNAGDVVVQASRPLFSGREGGLSGAMSSTKGQQQLLLPQHFSAAFDRKEKQRDTTEAGKVYNSQHLENCQRINQQGAHNRQIQRAGSVGGRPFGRPGRPSCEGYDVNPTFSLLRSYVEEALDEELAKFNAMCSKDADCQRERKEAKKCTNENKRKRVKDIAPGAPLNDFVRIKTLGTGSFGNVLLVKHKVTKRYCAMKVMEKEKIVRLKQVDHTLNERRILAAIDFPFIVNLVSSSQDSVYLYMGLEYVQGGELFTLLRKTSRFSESTARFYAAQVVSSFVYLHRLFIIYRDLKPENILIDSKGYLKITDFGFAKKVEARTWTLCGTPEYLAPEIILSRGYNHTVDWWALGILIYEMVAGYPPFFADSPIKIYEAIVSGELLFPEIETQRDFGDGRGPQRIRKQLFSPQLKNLISQLLSRDLTTRLGNMRNGYWDIIKHPWFMSAGLAPFDWVSCMNRQLPAPYLCPVTGPEDTSYFDAYEEEPLNGVRKGSFDELFEGF
eukprot:Nk52_evm26s147 gene=Nk52_evmTU26s147